MKQLIFFVLAMFLMAFAPHSYALGDPEAGKEKAQVCVACHGPDGNSVSPAYPKIAGQNEVYLIEQLLDFKRGKGSGRDNPIMQGIVANLSKEDIENLAAYYARLMPTYGEAQPKYVELGKRIYQGGISDKGIPACMACHDPQGLGNGQAGFPHLGGQYPEYISAQLLAYKTNQRRNDINSIMRGVASKLSDEEIAAVASYISGLH